MASCRFFGRERSSQRGIWSEWDRSPGILTVPLYCKGFCDPGEATRDLARLPPGAARHRVHVLSDPARGAERLVFVGDLGLRGGGDRDPPSGSDSPGRRAASRFRRRRDHRLVEPYIVRYFVGRKDQLSEMIEAFESSDESLVVRAIVGPGGIGKTQLATRLFDLFRGKRHYDDEFWIPSSSRETLTATFLQIAEYLRVRTDTETPELIKRVREELGRSHCFYVFDDAPNFELIREYVPATSGHVIVTTREAGGGDWESNMLRLGPFDEDEARILAERLECGRSMRPNDLDDLMDLLPRIPLVLAQFFSVMRDEERSSPAEWVQRLLRYEVTGREAKAIEELSATRIGEEASGMVFVFNWSVQRISEEPNDLGPRSLDILAKLALLDPNGVPVEWMYKWHEADGGEFAERTQNSIRILERFSHVAWDTKTNQIYIHAETQLLARHLLLKRDDSASSHVRESEEQQKNAIGDHVKTIVASISRYIDEWRTDRSNRELWSSLARNGSTLLKHCESSQDTGVEIKLLQHTTRSYREICMFQESITHAQKALDMCERLHGDADHPDTVQCIKNYAVGLERTGRDNEAVPLYKKALDMCARLHGDADHPDTVQCIKSYSAGLDRTGRINEAVPLYKRALDMCERLHGDADHPDTVQCIKSYAIGLERTGRDNESLPFRKRALDMCERLHGDADHPDTVDCIKNYAIGLDRTGRINEAMPLYKRALDMCDRLHGDADHPDTVDCIKSYAIGLGRTGRDNEAVPLYKRALDMCERLYGDADHPDTVQCMSNYAACLSRIGMDNEALLYTELVNKMRERLGDM